MSDVILIQETDVALAELAFDPIAMCLGEALSLAQATQGEMTERLKGKKVVRVIVEVE